MNRNFIRKQIGVPLEKDLDLSSGDSFIVRGYFTSDKKDEIGDIITREATQRAIPKYRQWGNIRYMHQPRPVAKVSKIGTEDGLEWNEVEIDVKDKEAQQQIDDELLQALSVGIIIRFEDIEFGEGDTWIINDYQLAEISLVDHPANYDAKLFVDEDKSVSVSPTIRESISSHGFAPVVNKLFNIEMEASTDNATSQIEEEVEGEIAEEVETEIEAEFELDAEAEVEAEVEEELEAETEVVEAELDSELEAEVEVEEEVELELDAEVEEELETEAETEVELELESEVEEELEPEIEEEVEVEAELDAETEAEAEVEGGVDPLAEATEIVESDISDEETLVEVSEESDEMVDKVVAGVLAALKSAGALPETEAESHEEETVEVVEEAAEDLSEVELLRSVVLDLSKQVTAFEERLDTLRVPRRKGKIQSDDKLPHETYEDHAEEEEEAKMGPLSRARKNYMSERTNTLVVKARGSE